MKTVTSACQLAALGLLVSWALWTLVLRWRRYNIARARGCKPVTAYPREGWAGSSSYDTEQKQAWKDGRWTKWGAEQYVKCGTTTYSVDSIGEQTIMSCDVLNQQTLCTNLDDWVREARAGGRPFFGSSIMNRNGAAWRHTRGLVSPLFKRTELSEIENFERFVDIMIPLIPRNGDTFDMQPLARKLFIDSSTEFIFGESLGSLRDTTGRCDEFIATLNRATAGAGKRIRPTGLISKLYAYGLPERDSQWLADIKVVHDYVDRRIAQHRSIDEDSSTTTPRKRYLLIDGMSEAFADPIDLRFQLLAIFALARETSAMAFSNILFLLARSPKIWTRLREQSLARGDRPITSEWLRTLTLFRHTVYESLRMQNPAPRFRREAAHDTILPRGGGTDGSAPLFVRKGQLVTIDKYPIWQDPEIWGEDVNCFRPDRFDGKRLGWEFMPFNGGPQACPANQQVVQQCVYLLVRLTREFDRIENRDPCLEFLDSAQMCLESRNGCKIALHRVGL